MSGHVFQLMRNNISHQSANFYKFLGSTRNFIEMFHIWHVFWMSQNYTLIFEPVQIKKPSAGEENLKNTLDYQSQHEHMLNVFFNVFF